MGRNELSRLEEAMKQNLKIRIIATVTFVCVFAIFSLAAMMEGNRAVEAHKRELADQISIMNTQIENLLSSRIFLAQGIVSYIKVNPELNEDEAFDYSSGLYDLEDTLIRSITVIKDTTIAYVFPIDPNSSAIGKDLSKVEGQKETVLKVKNERDLILTGPVNLIQGGQGIIARIPVVLGNNSKKDPYWGQVSLVIAYDVLADEAGINELGKDSNINIYTHDPDDNQKKTVWTNEESALLDPIRGEIHNPSTKWLVEAQPKTGWVRQTPMYYGLILTGFAFGVIAALYVSNLLLSNEKLESHVRERTDQLIKTNEYLEVSMAELEENQAQLTVVNDQLEKSFSDLKETQDQLINSEKLAALGQLVAGVAHEINTPLGIGITLATFIQEEMKKLKSNHDAKTLNIRMMNEHLASVMDAVEVMVRNLEKSSEIVVGFKQVAIDQSTFEVRKFKMDTYIKEIIRNLTPKLKKTRHRIEVDCPDNLEIVSYPGAISQILTNLVMNSLIHGFEEIQEGIINIEVKKEKEVIIFKYCDNGVGIKLDMQEKVFDPFYTTKKNQGSTGLGLHIIHNLVVQALEGRIHLESSQNDGVVFHIEFKEASLMDLEP